MERARRGHAQEPAQDGARRRAGISPGGGCVFAALPGRSLRRPPSLCPTDGNSRANTKIHKRAGDAVFIYFSSIHRAEMQGGASKEHNSKTQRTVSKVPKKKKTTSGGVCFLHPQNKKIKKRQRRGVDAHRDTEHRHTLLFFSNLKKGVDACSSFKKQERGFLLISVFKSGDPPVCVCVCTRGKKK